MLPPPTRGKLQLFWVNPVSMSWTVFYQGVALGMDVATVRVDQGGIKARTILCAPAMHCIELIYLGSTLHSGIQWNLAGRDDGNMDQ